MQTVILTEEVTRSLAIGRGREDEALVVGQHLQPVVDIGGVVWPGSQLEIEVGAQEGSAQLGDQFLAGIAVIAPALAAEVAVEARRVACRLAEDD